jgi:adenylate cyclase
MPEDRRLAAIMFTDIVGYTALMGSDEDKAFQLLRKNREIQRPIIKKYRGEWLKEMGDGILASFHTSSDAVRCAGEIQNEAKKAGIPLRIGIHEGEVVFEGGDVFGTGVNVASRLEELAEEGCINISGAIYKDIKNKAGIVAEFVEEKELKNVDELIKVYKVKCEESVTEQSGEDTPKTSKSKLPYYIIGVVAVVIVAFFLIWQFLPPKEPAPIVEETETVVDKSIAVLPFTDMSPNKDQEYLSDGMMDEILMHLFKIGGLKVTSRTSVTQYKGTTKTAPQIAKELGVTHVLEGSVSKSGDRIKIIAQLIDGTKDQHLWAESYDRELTDVFSIQSEVAQKIASSLKVVISPEVQDRIETNPTYNMTAYDNYLKGNVAYWRSWEGINKDVMNESVKYYENAIELDPNFSLAYTGLGRSYWWLGLRASNTDRPALYEKSKMYLKKAIDLDPYNGWAYAEMSVVSIEWDWDSTATRKNLDMAIKLMPNDFNAYIHSFYFEWRLGNCDQMINIQNDYKRFSDNVDHPFSGWSLRILSCQKKFSEIARLADKYWEEKINNQQAWNLFFSYLMLGDYNNAEKVVAYIKNNIEVKSYFFSVNGVLKAKQGNMETAIAMCDSLKLMDGRNSFIAEIYAALGDKEKMYEYLNKAIMEREAFHQWIMQFPELIDCENDPEFQNIIKEIWTPRE